MIELWLIDLEAAAPALQVLERDVPRLSADDRARALRLDDAQERHRRLAAYMGLRVVLERVGGAGVRGQRLVRGPAGKPHLAAGGPAFSLAHSGGMALIGVVRTGAVGVDLEAPRALRMSSRRREEIVAAAAGLAGRPHSEDPAADDTLLRAWCRLEAFAKAHGGGISHLLTEIGIRGPDGRQLPLARIEGAAHRLAQRDRLEIADLAMPPGLLAAVAAPEHPRSRQPRAFPAETTAIARIADTRTAPRRAPAG
jgi:4'-phosphopantetheinyl transferase